MGIHYFLYYLQMSEQSFNEKYNLFDYENEFKCIDYLNKIKQYVNKYNPQVTSKSTDIDKFLIIKNSVIDDTNILQTKTLNPNNNKSTEKYIRSENSNVIYSKNSDKKCNEIEKIEKEVINDTNNIQSNKLKTGN